MNDNDVDVSKRWFLTKTATIVGAAGAALAAIPFISSMQPSAKAQAAEHDPVEKEFQLLTSSHGVKANRGLCLDRFCGGKASRSFAMGSFTGGASMEGIATFLGHPERRRIIRTRLRITSQGFRLISIFSFRKPIQYSSCGQFP